MKLQRVALSTAVLLAATMFFAPLSRGATTAAPSGLPIFQFVNSGSGPLPWNAASIQSALNNTTMLGAAHAASNATEGVLAYRTATNDLALYSQPPSGPTQWVDVSTELNLPTPGGDPIPFFDPSGAVDLLYVDTTGHLILESANDPVTPLWHNLHRGQAWRPFVTTDLSTLTGVTFANGLASIQVNGLSATVAARTVTNSIEVMTLSWDQGHFVPYLSGTPTNVTNATSTTSAMSDPVVLATSQPSVVTTSATGDLILYSANTTSSTTTTTTTSPVVTTLSWSSQDLTTLTQGPKVAGPLATSATPTNVYVAALGANGAVELFSTPLTTFLTGAATSHTAPVVTTSAWSVTNVTTSATGAPPLSGTIFLDATPSVITIAGQAANWGDLFAFTTTGANGAWVATDVSVTAGSSARTVASSVTGFHSGPNLILFAAGVASPPPQGVGVYAIPTNKWSQAITDGWPIISETGGLGTQATPWVGWVSAKSVATSPDFLIGQSIYNSHKRVTWLSFWTVSGPLPTEPQEAATYYTHGFAAGVWVATQIDQYRTLGVGLKPDWVIFDPEGYPDNHSNLDAPSGSSPSTLALYATYWSSMLKGWAAGLASVDPQLNAGVYASQSEYRNYALATSPLPVFEAVAFGGGGPLPIAGASGSNIRGYIAFSAVCNPVATLKNQEATLKNPPWSGQFNTLQFNAGVYCPPA